MNTPRLWRSRGFTLIEMAIVVLIISIVSAVVAPRLLDAISYQRVEAAAQRIRRDLELARQTARIRSTRQSVLFTLDSDSYTLPGIPDFDRPGHEYTVHLGESPLIVVISSISLGGDAELVFDGFGLPDTTGSVTVQAGSHERTIIVESDGCVTTQ